MAAPQRQAMRLLSQRLQCLSKPSVVRQTRSISSRYSNATKRTVTTAPSSTSPLLEQLSASAGARNPLDVRAARIIEAEAKAHNLQRMRIAGMGLILSMGGLAMVIFNLDLDSIEQAEKQRKGGQQLDASDEANARFQGKEVHVIGAGDGKRIVASGAGEQVELVETGTSSVPHFPRTIYLPSSSDSTRIPGVVAVAQPNADANPGNTANQEEYTLVGLGIRTVMWIQVYVVGMYVRTNDITALQAKLVRNVNPTASALIPSEKEDLKKKLLDPEESRAIWAELLAVPGIKTAFRISPTRSTNFSHLRDGFVSGINNRTGEARSLTQGGITEYDSEEFGRSVQDLKAIFKGSNAPKGSVLVLSRDERGTLDVLYQPKPEQGEQAMERLGSLPDERVSRLLWFGYLAGAKVSSQGARDGIVNGCMDEVDVVADCPHTLEIRTSTLYYHSACNQSVIELHGEPYAYPPSSTFRRSTPLILLSRTALSVNSYTSRPTLFLTTLEKGQKMVRSIALQATNWKRRSLKTLDTEQVTAGKTTTVYVVLSAELRSDQDVYMFSIDKCYTTLHQANARVELLGHCNVNMRSVETRLAFTDPDTGCLTVRWGRYGSQSRFVALIDKLEMVGSVIDNSKGNTSPGGWNDPEAEIGAFFAETHLDLSGHIWVVAMHAPVSAKDSPALARQNSHSRAATITAASLRSKPSAKSSLAAVSKALTPLAESQPPKHHNTLLADLGWALDSLHPSSDPAIARAKKSWNESFSSHGRCRKVREHYGFARYAFKPALLDKRRLAPGGGGDYDAGCVQIRVERVRVVPVGDAPEYHIPSAVVEKDTKAGLVAPVMRNVGGEVISTAAGCRTSFLDSLERIAEGGGLSKYEALPLALKIRKQHMERWSDTAVGEQKYALPVVAAGAKERGEEDKVAGDMYHALLHGSDVLSANKRVSARPPSKAYLKAQARMAAAIKDRDEDHEEEIDVDAMSEARQAKNSLELETPTHELQVPAQVLRRKPQRSQLKPPQPMLLSTQLLTTPRRRDSVTEQHQAVAPLKVTTVVKKMGMMEARANMAFDGLWF
ncbi:Altered inheritance of mitochondria protein 18 mitochondrial [Friedmanniomyces endolithicus]|nr:Altered inheritance of mitochondria protein 18 mitochondrial [Friedmanniomyces endolithicus]